MTADEMTAIQPEQVYALVVGIESYDLGTDYDLNGPARDGLNFIDWLLSKGVLPEHIHFFVSPLVKNEDVKSQAIERGIQSQPGTRQAIDAFIREQLIAETSHGELLYVFWGGHGILTKTQKATRRLLFADTTAVNKLNLDVDSFVDALRTSAFGKGFERQVLLFDACANTYFQGLYETIQGELAGQSYSSTGEHSKAEQFVLFAADEYEVAVNDAKAGAGLFSKAVLSELQGQSLLFPDISSIAELVKVRFCKRGLDLVYWSFRGNGSHTEIENLKRIQKTSQQHYDGASKETRLRKEIQLLEKKLDRCFEKRLLTDDPDREVTLENLEKKLEEDIAIKKKELEGLD